MAFMDFYNMWNVKLDIIVMGTITGAPLLPLVTDAWNIGQGHNKPLRSIIW